MIEEFHHSEVADDRFGNLVSCYNVTSKQM